MPQRAMTPPPPDDSLFFTVVNPYPQQPYLTIEDSKAFSRWIASIVGQHNLYAFYHKPKSPRMVIVEVSKEGFTDFRQLLGGHRWRDILRTPSNNQAHEVSSIFPCTLTTPRSLEKERWQQVDIEASWFRRWSPQEDSDIIFPYPLPRFCQPPQEDIMRNPLCRPLREELFLEGTGTRPPAESSAAVPFAYRSPLGSDTDDEDIDPEYGSSESDERLPTPFGLTPPGLAPLSGTLSSTPFVAAIHGADAPKSDSITVVLPRSGSDADTDGETLWAGYGETEAAPPADLCKVHGVLCSGGICRQQGMHKREELRAKRVHARLAERDAWHSSRDGGYERRRRGEWGAKRRDSSAGSEGGNGSRGEARVRGANSAFSSSAAAGSMPKPVARPLPPHLRKDPTKVADATSPSPAPGLATATTSQQTLSPSPPSPGSADGEQQSTNTTSPDSRSTNVSDVQSTSVAKGKNKPPQAKVAPYQATTDVSRDTRKPVQLPQCAPMRWADMVDDDEDEEDEEEDDRDGDDLDDLPHGVTIIPGAVYREDDADRESAFSGWDEDAEPF